MRSAFKRILMPATAQYQKLFCVVFMPLASTALVATLLKVPQHSG
jgi:hypothetical protein